MTQKNLNSEFYTVCCGGAILPPPPLQHDFFCNVGMSCEKASISLNATCSYQAGYKPGSMLNKVVYGQFPPRGPTLYPFIYHFSGRCPYRIPTNVTPS